MGFVSKRILALTIVSTSLQLTAEPKILSTSYEENFPLRFEICALTDAVAIPAKMRFDWGHIVMFMSGVCRETNANKPTVKTCFDNKDGVTISVNSQSKNVNWLAVPGRSLSFFGELGSKNLINKNAYDTVKEKLKSLDLYRGIDVHKPVENDEAKIDLLANASLTMEAGITFARNMNCIKVPVTQQQVSEAVAYLNSLNDQYFKTRDFKWNPLFNNCAHLVHNILAKINFWNYKKVDTPWYGIVGNAAVPGNEPWDLAQLVYETDLADPVAVFKNTYFKKSLEQYNLLPVRHGILMEQIDMYTNNEIFSPKKISFHTLQLPESKISYSRYSKDASSNPIFTDMSANLKYFKEKYQIALTKKTPLSAHLAGLNRDQQAEFSTFYNHYYSYLANQLDEINQTLKKYEN